MICKNCGSFYVREPCPSCNSDNSKEEKDAIPDEEAQHASVRPSSIRKRENIKETESGGQILVQKEEDTLVKPSQRLKQEEEEEEIDHLVKPSERVKQEETKPSPDQLVKPSQRLKKEKERDTDQDTRQVKPSDQFKSGEQADEHLVKPSERLKQDKIPDEEEEHLVKPSERFKPDDEDIPSFQRFDQEQSSQAPKKVTRIKQVEEDIPSFKRFEPRSDETEDISMISKRLSKPDQQEKLKNDKEYRNKVKETLEEVMGLLEKLIDEE